LKFLFYEKAVLSNNSPSRDGGRLFLYPESKMLVADITKKHADYGGYYFGNGRIKMKILYQ
jgi:hypothetical protein